MVRYFSNTYEIWDSFEKKLIISSQLAKSGKCFRVRKKNTTSRKYLSSLELEVLLPKKKQKFQAWKNSQKLQERVCFKKRFQPKKHLERS